MAEITINSITDSGINLTPVTANSGGDYFVNNGKTIIKIINGSGSSITVTFDAPNLCSHGHNHDSAIIVTAGETVYVGDFTPQQYNTNGIVNISYSDVTSLTIAGMKL